MREEFGLDPLSVNKRQFVVKKADVPDNGEDTIELLDYLLYLRSNETEEEVVSEDTFNELQDLAIEITNEVEDALEDIRDDLEAEIDDEVDDDFDDEVDDDELDDESDSAAGANEETDSDEPAESTTPTETADDSDAESTLEEQNEKLVEENDILNLALRAALDKVENLLSVVESYRDDLNTY